MACVLNSTKKNPLIISQKMYVQLKFKGILYLKEYSI